MDDVVSRRDLTRTKHLRRRVALAGVVVALLATAVAASGVADLARPSPGYVTVMLRGETLASLALAPYVDGDEIDRGRLAADVFDALPRRHRFRRRRESIDFQLDRRRSSDVAARVAISGGVVGAFAEAVSARRKVPVVRQRFRNNCETAALSALLASVGISAGQTSLQAQVRKSLPLDPIGSDDSRVWGDPEEGFVGRVDGGGPAGGFGVYERPIVALARKRGATLERLTRAKPDLIYRRLRQGRAVMAWIGLSDGPYEQWRSRRGRAVRVNWGEHTVVLHGIDENGNLDVMNPLTGTRERWSQTEFETKWRLLDRRAVGI